jgi:hypothetical protein
MVKRIRLSPKYLPLFHQLIPHLLAGRTIKEAAQKIDQSLNECYRSIQFARYYYKSRTTFELVYRYLLETGQAEPIPGSVDTTVSEEDRSQLTLFL